MSELDSLTVHEHTDLGWCSAALPNETTDQDGNLAIFDERQRDPRVPAKRVFEDSQVQALRTYLKENNGLIDVELCEPDELDRITRIFHRDGFVVVKNLLLPEDLERFRQGCVNQLKEILSIKGKDGRKYISETGRLPHRYSYGTSSASRQLLHDPIWASMVDLPATTPILKSLFGPGGYHVLGSGGDLCLPGAIEYQVLHVDFREDYAIPAGRLQQAGSLGVEPRKVENGELDPRSQQMILVKTPPIITINFFMSDLTWENGPIRHIPGSHAMPFAPPGQPEEPEWMRLCTLAGAPAGAGVFRDSRAWHGATPNVSKEVRAMPNVEYAAPWVADDRFVPTMPHEIWSTLSDHAKKICAKVKAEPGVWPAGAGVMHPLANERLKAKEKKSHL